MDALPPTPNEIAIDICVCTYRRPHVAETLRSLARLNRQPNWALHVIVADNDQTEDARMRIEEVARENKLALTYVHAPARNISIARNACLDAATAAYIAFIDDDEMATPQWLDVLMAVMNAGKADVVLGPVQAVYGPDCPGWMRKGDFHSTRPVWVGGEIITGYTCNVLMRSTAPVFRGLRFREELGRSGGEDTFFFAALHKAGGRIAYAPDAIVTEALSAERASMKWLRRRVFRTGQTHGFLLLQDGGDKPLPRFKNIALAAAKAAFCFAAAVPCLPSAARLHYWILRGTLHAGVVSRLLGGREIEPYGH